MSNLERNKQNAVNFYQMAYLGDPKQAVERYVGKEYIQHNPLVDDGVEGFIAYFERMATEHPHKEITFLRVIAEGDLVALHTHQVWPGDDDYVTMDFFRCDEEGKLVEHWDSIQALPAESLNENSMY